MTAREIRQTFRRFLALFMMAALGTGVFAGIHMAMPDFVNTVNQFYQKSEVYDYRMTSSLGWDETSMEEIRGRERVQSAEGVWQQDALFDIPGEETPRAYRVHSLTTQVNKVSLTKGQLPEIEGECLVDASHHKGIEIGDTIKLSGQNDAQTAGAFKVKELKVTGFGDSPLYTTSERGETAIGDGKITGFIVTGREAFAGELAAEVDVKLADRTRFMSEAYREMMDRQREDWQQATQATAVTQADRMRKAAEEELAAAKAELDKVKKAVKKKLAPAKKAMDDAKAKLDSMSSSIDSLQDEIDQLEEDLPDMEKAMNEAKARYDSEKAKAKKKKKKDKEQPVDSAAQQEYEKAKEEFEKAKEDIKSNEDKIRAQMDSIDAANDDYNEKMLAYTKKEAKESKVLVEPQNTVNAAQAKLDSIKEPLTELIERSADESYTTFENDFRVLDQVTGIYPGLFLLTASLGCAGMSAYWIHRRRRQIGLKKSLGMSKTQISAGNAVSVAAVTMIGSVAGYYLGSSLIPRVIWRAYRTGGITLAMDGKFGLKIFLGCLLLPLICVLAGTALASHKILSQSAASLIMEEETAQGRHLLLERISEIWEKIPFTTAVAIRRVLSNKKRLLAAIVGFGLCVALMLTGLGIKDAVADFERIQYDTIQVADAEVDYTGGKEGEAPTTVMSGVTKIGGKAIAFVSDVRDVRIGEEDFRVHILSPYDRGNINHFFVLRDAQDHGLSLPKEGEALISRGLAVREKIKKGDTVILPAQFTDEELKAQAEKKDEKKDKKKKDKQPSKQDVTLKVAGIFTNYVNDYVVVPPVALVTTDGAANVNSLYVNFAKEADADQSQTALSSLDNVTKVTMARQNKQRVAPAMSQMRTIAWITALGAAILALWFMVEMAYGEMSTRKREWRVYRMLGFERQEMVRPILLERLILTVLGTIAGLLVGTAVYHRVMRRIVSDVFYIPARLSILSYAGVIVLMLIFTLAAHLTSRSVLPKRTGSRRRRRKSKSNKSGRGA